MLGRSNSFWKLQNLIKDGAKSCYEKYDYFLFLDFEATCDFKKIVIPQEIIEIPCLKVQAESMEIQSTFHKYIKPKMPLTPFCTKLTGITQEMLDDEKDFPEVFSEFLEWQETEKLWIPGVKSIFITSGDWDLRTMLPKQCQQYNVSIPTQFHSWINLKKIYSSFRGTFPSTLTQMCNSLNLRMVGRLHSGIDDCRNMHLILLNLKSRNVIVESVELSKLEGS